MRELDRADLILHAGDFVAAEVFDALRELAPVDGVHGNQDDPELRLLLPARCVVDVAGHRIGIVHDPGPQRGREARLAARFPDCELVVYGHTHIPELTRHGTLTLLNPGSPTERRRGPYHAMGIVTVGESGLDTNICSL